jgi:anti-sigma B factor antagonist
MENGAKLLIHTMFDVTIVNFEEARVLDMLQIEQIGKELYRLVDEMDRKKLILDFTKVQFLSSAAVGVLIILRKKSAAIKGSLAICGMRKQLMEVFEIMKIKKLFTFCADEHEALKKLGIGDVV